MVPSLSSHGSYTCSRCLLICCFITVCIINSIIKLVLCKFSDIVKIIERTVRSEYYRSPNRPVYIVGESVGACLALDVAASNPDIDIVLILANPGKRILLAFSLFSCLVLILRHSLMQSHA